MFKPHKLNDNCYLSNSWPWTPVFHGSNTNLSNSELWSLAAECLRFIEVSGGVLTSTPGRAITRCEIWVPLTPAKFNTGTIRRNQPASPDHHGSLVIYHNDRCGGKRGEGIMLFSRRLDVHWRGCWASPPSARRQLLLLAGATSGLACILSCLRSWNCVTLLLPFANSIKTVSSNCTLFLPTVIIN